MKHSSPWSSFSKLLFRTMIKLRRILPLKICQAFGINEEITKPRIDCIYVINLTRQPFRLMEIKRELLRLRNYKRVPLWTIANRYPAIDANQFVQDPVKDADVDPAYTLAEQLFVEPQPLALPTDLELSTEIQMSWPEIAVAKSHIGTWRKAVQNIHEYALIIEDDVWFRPGFTDILDRAWSELHSNQFANSNFDVLYLSFEEVKNGAPKVFISETLFRPVKGLWNLSGYVISRKGAEKLLQLLPCNGPIDLWINHQFKHLNVIATRKSIISQRPDLNSTNSYSILPTLTKIGAINSESAALFQNYPTAHPVFVFGQDNSGLTSIAMALSMLGYRCCNDLQTIPFDELKKLINGENDYLFNAYVNVGCLVEHIEILIAKFPKAKFLLTCEKADLGLGYILELDYKIIKKNHINKWQLLCDYLNCVPPACTFPELQDLGKRVLSESSLLSTSLKHTVPKRDKSPWVIEQQSWNGINCIPLNYKLYNKVAKTNVKETFGFINQHNWILRNDTFTDNLALFRPENICVTAEKELSLVIKDESLGVRNYSAAALTSRKKFLYGRFETILKASNAPGVITGFFLHRNSPRQEIDIEIAGHQPHILIANVFYNPGGEGAKFDYGYRGASTYIHLGFDASVEYHQYAIEWSPTEILWYVDNQLIHRRGDWNPTPVPQLPMSLHANIWPCRSKEFAGRLNDKLLPATTFINSIVINANQYKSKTYHEDTFL